MQDVRRAVKTRLKELGWSIYRLTKELRGKVAEQTIYSFLGGRKSAINSDALGLIMKVLDLEIRVKDQP